jgi:DNA repair protein RadA/Sms
MAVFKCSGQKRFDEDGNPYCTYEAPKPWRFRCPQCHRFYTPLKVGADRERSKRSTLASAGAEPEKPRISTGFSSFDEVLGGGLVLGATVFLSGPPGTGKTTLMIQVASAVATGSRKVLYTSGEQTLQDIGAAAKRVGALNEQVTVLGLQGDIYKITDEAEQLKPALLIVDSLQTAALDDVKGEEGSSDQCKAVTNYLTAWGKREHIPILIISHVNKEGSMAGPLAAQHYCDTILELDPAPEIDEFGDIVDGTQNYIALTSAKNRNGASNITAFFDMTAEGLKSVRKKSKLYTV